MELRPLGPWTDQRNMTSNYVPELGQFIQPGAAEEAAQGSDAAVIGSGPDRAGGRLGVWHHCPELYYFERIAQMSLSDLGVKNWPGRCQHYCQRDEWIKNGGDRAEYNAKENITGPFGHFVAPLVVFG